MIKGFDIKMAHLLYDAKYLFNIEQLNPLQICELTIGDEICLEGFLPVRWACSNNASSYIWKAPRVSPLLLSAIRSDSVECLDHLCDQRSVQAYDLRCLKYIHARSYTWNIIFVAAQYGSLNCLQYLVDTLPHTQYKELLEAPGGSPLSFIAAYHGHLDCLIYLCEIESNLDNLVCYAAVNDLDCLMYLHSKGYPWYDDLYHNAIIYDNIECLQYILKNRTDQCLSRDYADISALIKYIRTDWNEFYMDCTVKLFDNALTYNINDLGEDYRTPCNIAIIHGKTDHLIYLLKQGYKLSDNFHLIACTVAARFGYLECLKYLHEEGYPWNTSTLAAARKGKNNDCIRYILENAENRELYPHAYMFSPSIYLNNLSNYLKSWMSIYCSPKM